MEVRVFDGDQLASDELICPRETAINQPGGSLIELKQQFLPADVSIALIASWYGFIQCCFLQNSLFFFFHSN
ncbi:hypothetical protein Y032_0097g2995 [Ancylostoma ceylanicum]|uniref:Uncharacterized protein n=1 Tax=Ancylostoma ceylanicum TaxID=53326 RepID=A0A016TJM0_9BILA|nr:hypothetical protein Y032_0097g2995 [Ancylostoma ceylanicum]